VSVNCICIFRPGRTRRSQQVEVDQTVDDAADKDTKDETFIFITWLVLGQRQRGESYWVVQVFPLSRLGRQGISTNNLLFVVPFYEPSLLETGYFILRF